MKMLLRLWLRSLQMRRSFPLVLTMTVAAGTMTGLLNLNADLDAKLNREFRNFGANAVITSDGQRLKVEEVTSLLSPEDRALPYSYVIAKTREGIPVVVAGVDISQALEINRWWKIDGAPNETAVIVGRRVAEQLGSGALELSFHGRKLTLNPTRTLSTGGPEDSRIFLPLVSFTNWTSVEPNTIELVLAGNKETLESKIDRLAAALPELQVSPVRQLLESEGHVLRRTQSLMYAAIATILLLVLLGAGTALSGAVFERQKDFAIMKALGSSGFRVGGILLFESLLLALVASIAGYTIGCAISWWIGKVNFHSAVQPRLEVLPMVATAIVAVALASSILPLWRISKIMPAGILKGE